MVKLIKHTGECDHPDDPTLPYKLVLVMRPPEMGIVAFVGLFGGVEEVVARAETHEELSAWMSQHGLGDHPRLIRFSISDNADKVVESFDRSSKQIKMLSRRLEEPKHGSRTA